MITVLKEIQVKISNENFGIKEIVAVKGINLLKLNLM
jgi:hypothetical protein